MAKATDLIKLVDDELQIKEIQTKEVFKSVLSQSTPQVWKKQHPMAKNVQYIPIDKIEHLLDTLFLDWKIEVLNVMQLAQSIAVTVRVHYQNPVTKEWSFHDGVGATPIQTQKGASAADLSKINTNAIQLGLPAAKSYAIKDATDHIGNIFGRNMNRAETIEYQAIYTQKEAEEKQTQSNQDNVEKITSFLKGKQ